MSDAKSSITSCDDFPPLDVYENRTKALKNGDFRTKNKLSHWKQEEQIQKKVTNKTILEISFAIRTSGTFGVV